MKAFDPRGEYTPEEVHNALAGVSNTREIFFRYEHLTKDGAYLGDMDYVQNCTIENNYLADIKRTAKFDLLDTGNFNYLQDRIKPYVGIRMPQDEDYETHVASLSPTLWWKFDDRHSTIPEYVRVDLPDEQTFTTREDAYPYPAITNGTTDVYFRADKSGTYPYMREELWTIFELTDRRPIKARLIELASESTATIYYSTDVDGPLETIATYTLIDDVVNEWLELEPRRGFYFVHIESTTSTTYASPLLSLKRLQRIEDSSGSGIAGVNEEFFLDNPSLINGGPLSRSIRFDTEEDYLWDTVPISMPLSDSGYSLSYWLKHADLLSSTNVGVTLELPESETTVRFTFDLFPGSTLRLRVEIISTDSTFPFEFFTELYYQDVERFLDGNAHMVTFVVDKSRGIGGYLDSSFLGWMNPLLSSTADFTTVSSVFGSGRIVENIHNSVFLYEGTSIFMDEYLMFNHALSAKELSDMYELALRGPSKRRGYVEWPQGVFVVSSPSRVMEGGNTIVRQVEAYDQLVVLHEDSFSTRYSVAKNTRYTDAISSVLNTTSTSINRKITKSTATTPVVLEWEPGTSKLQVINDLLAAINYESAYFDEDGVFIGSGVTVVSGVKIGKNARVGAGSVVISDIADNDTVFGNPATSVKK